MLRRLAALLLAPLLASCQPSDILVHAAFLGGSLAFVAADPGDADADFCWYEAVVVDDRLQPAWRFTGPGSGACGRLLPLYYGRAPDRADTATPPRRLEPGRLYLVVGDATAGVYGAFALSRAGERLIVHNVDPESPAAAGLRERWRRGEAGRAAATQPVANSAN